MKSTAETMRERLFAVAKIYARAKNIKLTSIGMYATKDGRLFDRLRDGGGMSPDTYDRVMQWLSDNWPKGKWPEDVPRPEKQEKMDA
jgi:hypothetical protein